MNDKCPLNRRPEPPHDTVEGKSVRCGAEGQGTTAQGGKCKVPEILTGCLLSLSLLAHFLSEWDC